MINKGKVIILLGISCAGKTYYKNLLADKFNLKQLKRITTREMRDVKENVTDQFITKKEFLELKKAKKLFSYGKINGNYYANTKEDIYQFEEGVNLIGDYHYKYLKKIKKELKDNLVVICIQPDDFEYAKKLIEKQRKKDYKIRVKQAIKEYKYYEKYKKVYDYKVNSKYNKETDDEIIKIINNILNGI